MRDLNLSVLCSPQWTFSQVKWISSFLESDDEYFDAEDGDIQIGKSTKGSERKKVAEAPNEELINLLLKFEIKEVYIFVYKQMYSYYHCPYKLSNMRAKICESHIYILYIKCGTLFSSVFLPPHTVPRKWIVFF